MYSGTSWTSFQRRLRDMIPFVILAVASASVIAPDTTPTISAIGADAWFAEDGVSKIESILDFSILLHPLKASPPV
jgi:hypothetical protein